MKDGIQSFDRITLNSTVMGGKHCLRGLRVTVSSIIDLVTSGYSFQNILELYPYLELEDISEALRFASKSGGGIGL